METGEDGGEDGVLALDGWIGGGLSGGAEQSSASAMAWSGQGLLIHRSGGCNGDSASE